MATPTAEMRRELEVLAMTVAGSELLKSAIATRKLEPSIRAAFTARESCRNAMTLQLVGADADARTAIGPPEIEGWRLTIDAIVPAACEAVLPLCTAVCASLRDVVDPNMEDLRTTTGELLRDGCAEAVRCLRVAVHGQAGSDPTPSSLARRVLSKVSAANAEAQRQLLGAVMEKARRRLVANAASDEWGGSTHKSFPLQPPDELLPSLCQLGVQMRCPSAAYTSLEALTERLSEAAARAEATVDVTDGEGNGSAFAEEIGRDAAADEATASVREARAPSELRSALSAAQRAAVHPIVVEMGELRLREMEAAAETAVGAPVGSLAAAPATIAATVPAAGSAALGTPPPPAIATAAAATSDASEARRLRETLLAAAHAPAPAMPSSASATFTAPAAVRSGAAPDALPRHIVQSMSDEERLEAALAASRRAVEAEDINLRAALAASLQTAHPMPGTSSPRQPTASGTHRPGDGGEHAGLSAPMSAAAAAAVTTADSVLAVQLRAAELAEATEGFADSRVVGCGGFGRVYRSDEGRLPSIRHAGPCAVKRLDSESQQGVYELQNEVDLLAVCRHESLLPLLAFCLDPVARCLVYPYMAGGTLEHALRLGGTTGADGPRPSSTAPPLPWRARLRILRAASRALHYLHTPSGSKGVVLHR